MQLTVQGTVEDFDQARFQGSLGTYLKVSPADISLHVSAASVNVKSTITFADASAAGSVVDTMQDLASNLTALSAAVGVTVEGASDPVVSQVVFLAPSPPPPSPPPPSPPPLAAIPFAAAVATASHPTALTASALAATLATTVAAAAVTSAAVATTTVTTSTLSPSALATAAVVSNAVAPASLPAALPTPTITTVPATPIATAPLASRASRRLQPSAYPTAAVVSRAALSAVASQPPATPEPAALPSAQCCHTSQHDSRARWRARNHRLRWLQPRGRRPSLLGAAIVTVVRRRERCRVFGHQGQPWRARTPKGWV